MHFQRLSPTSRWGEFDRRTPVIDLDDKAGKPVGIQSHIGRRPIAAFGNSDGDLEMLEWVTSGPGPRFGLIVHYDNAEREAAYDRKSARGQSATAGEPRRQRVRSISWNRMRQ